MRHPKTIEEVMADAEQARQLAAANLARAEKAEERLGETLQIAKNLKAQVEQLRAG